MTRGDRPSDPNGSLDGRHIARTNAPEGAVEREVISMGNRLYVGNLSFQSTADSLRAAFAPFGSVTDVHLVTDRESGQSRGFGFVTMGTAQEAAKAIAEMNNATLDGRPLRVNEAEERPQGGRGGGGGGRGGGGGGKRERW
jgi:RNA recognition motif-containing protein